MKIYNQNHCVKLQYKENYGSWVILKKEEAKWTITVFKNKIIAKIGISNLDLREFETHVIIRPKDISVASGNLISIIK